MAGQGGLGGEVAPILSSFIDLLIVAYVDFAGLMSNQVHPDFLKVEGTHDMEALGTSHLFICTSISRRLLIQI